MATIKHKRGTSNPGTSDVAVGELAINTTDGGLFTQTDGGSVVEIGGSATDSTKMPLAGGTFTGDVLFEGATSGRDIVWDKSENRLWVKDNAEITFGTGHDMKLYHDGSNSIILDSGTGYLYLKGENVVLEDTSGDNYFLGIHDGECGVYYDGGVRIKTRSDGAEVLSANGSYAAFYISSDGGVGYNDYTDTWALVVGDGDGVFRLRSNASSSGYETAIKAVANGKVELRYNSSAKIETTSTGVTVTGTCTATAFAGDGSNLTGLPASVGGSTGVDFNDTVKARWGTGNDLEIFHDGNDYIKSVGTGNLYIDCTTGDLQIRGTGFSVMANFVDDGTVELYYDGSKKFETTSGGASVTGNITVSGTVDGRDLQTDGTKLDGIASSANNYTHPNHSGEVTSSADGATVIADNVVDEANLKVDNSPTDDYVLTAKSSASGGLTWAAASGGASATDVNVSKGFESAATVPSNWSIGANNNAMFPGPMTVASGVTITVPSNRTLTVV